MFGRIAAWVAVAVAVLASVYGVTRRGSAPVPAEADPVRIGVILPLSGDAAAYGIPIQNSIELAVAEVNEAGGMNGQPVRVAWYDGKCNGSDAATAAQQLVHVDGVRVVFGGACSDETMSIAPIAESKQALVMTPCAPSPKISDLGAYTFRTYPSDALAGRVAAGYAVRELGAKRVAIIAEATEDAQGLRNTFKVTVGQLGGAVVADEVHRAGTDDLRAQLVQVRGTNPDLVYVIPQSGNSGVRMLQQLRDLGYRGKRLTAAALMDRETVHAYARLLEGVIGIEAALDDANPNVEKFLAAYKGKYGEDLSGIRLCSANGYTQVRLLKAAVDATGNNTTAIRDWLTGRTGWEGPLGTLSLDRNGDVVTGHFGVRQVTNGQIRTLGTQRIVDGDLGSFVQ